MNQAIEELSYKNKKLRDEVERLDKENNFFHQSTTIFLTIKKVIEGEK